MHNNDILRRLRYTFDLSDTQMMSLFASGGFEASRAEISYWLKAEDDPECVPIYDKDLAAFLNGFINLKRGKKEGPQPKPEKSLSNNIILRKLKIALNLRDDDMIEIFKLARFTVSKHELSALFRRPEQKQYRPCKDQFLRNFLFGLQLKYRPAQD